MKYALEHGMINVSYVQEQMEMNERRELLEKHPYKIWVGTDGEWRTYLPDKDKGRVLVKRKKEEDVEDRVVKYWRQELENPTISEVFDEWNDRRLRLKKISPGTHQRYRQVFDRHFFDMKNKRIKSLDTEDYEEFLEEEIPKLDLSAKAFSNLKTITRGFLKRARKRKLVDFNVEEIFQRLDTSESDFKRVIKEDNEEVFTEEEFPIVMDYLLDNLDMKNTGILLMFLTGIRVGELVALKHSDFDENIISIRRTETRIPCEDGPGCRYEVKDFPKTQAGIRNVIIPLEYSWITDRIKYYNPFGEFIFLEGGRRLTTNCFRTRIRQICKKLNIVRKSPHKIRKTYGSILLDNSVDNRLIIDVMGHADISCTEGYYHKNRKTLERKSQIISSIPEFKVIKSNQK